MSSSQAAVAIRETAADPDRPPTQIPPAETPGLTGLLTLAVGVVVVVGLYLARDVLIPITLAVVLSFLIAPLVNLLRRIHFGRVLSVLVAVLIALTVILSLGALIGEEIAGLADEVPRYQTTIEHKISTVRGFAINHLNGLVNKIGEQLQHAGAPQPGAA